MSLQCYESSMLNHWSTLLTLTCPIIKLMVTVVIFPVQTGSKAILDQLH